MEFGEPVGSPEPEINFLVLELLEYAKEFGLFDRPGGMAALNNWIISYYR